MSGEEERERGTEPEPETGRARLERLEPGPESAPGWRLPGELEPGPLLARHQVSSGADAAEAGAAAGVEGGGEAGGDASAAPEPRSTAQEEREAAAPGRRRFGGGQTGFYLYGVVRTRGWRGREREEVLRVRYRDLEALVRPGPFKLPALDVPHLQAHQRTVEAIMRHATILPAPFGVVFRGRRPLVRFLEDQYLTLDEGLAFLEGHWEVRVHASPRGRETPTPELEDAAVHLYAELRRTARAAIPFPREERRLFSAAFLVERGAWIEFVNHADDLAAAHPALAFDVTGPWPPYDFVRMSV